MNTIENQHFKLNGPFNFQDVFGGENKFLKDISNPEIYVADISQTINALGHRQFIAVVNQPFDKRLITDVFSACLPDQEKPSPEQVLKTLVELNKRKSAITSVRGREWRKLFSQYDDHHNSLVQPFFFDPETSLKKVLDSTHLFKPDENPPVTDKDLKILLKSRRNISHFFIRQLRGFLEYRDPHLFKIKKSQSFENRVKRASIKNRSNENEGQRYLDEARRELLDKIVIKRLSKLIIQEPEKGQQILSDFFDDPNDQSLSRINNYYISRYDFLPFSLKKAAIFFDRHNLSSLYKIHQDPHQLNNFLIDNTGHFSALVEIKPKLKDSIQLKLKKAVSSDVLFPVVWWEVGKTKNLRIDILPNVIHQRLTETISKNVGINGFEYQADCFDTLLGSVVLGGLSEPFLLNVKDVNSWLKNPNLNPAGIVPVLAIKDRPKILSGISLEKAELLSSNS